MTTSPPPVHFYHLAGSISEQLIPGQCVSLHARGGCLSPLPLCVWLKSLDYSPWRFF